MQILYLLVVIIIFFVILSQSQINKRQKLIVPGDLMIGALVNLKNLIFFISK